MNGVLELFTETDSSKLIDHIKKEANLDLPVFLWIDLFCGAGGVTEGYSRVENNFVVACVNHDEYAIKSHHLNHPSCIHYTEDIRDWAVIYKIEALVKELKAKFPAAVVGLHASLECTHQSKAKGGGSRDADSRTLGDHLYKYLCIPVDYITIENVEEFMSWGPLYQASKDGQWRFEDKKRRSVWQNLPYDNHEDFFDKKKLKPYCLPIKERKAEDYDAWREKLMSYGFQYERAVLNAADFGEYTSRKRYFGCFAKDDLPIAFPEPTHVKKEKMHLFPKLKVHNAVREKLNLEDEGISLFGLNKSGKPYVKATFGRVLGGLKKYHKEGYFLIRCNGGDLGNKNGSVNKPLSTILTNNVHGLIEPIFLTSYYGASKNGNGVHSLDKPCNTISTKDTFSLHHLQYAYSNATYSKITEPSQAILVRPKQELITTKWLYDTQYGRVGCSIHKPCPTIIARQDKKPLYLASATTDNKVDNSLGVIGDNAVKEELRALMRELGITDIKIRSLEVDELQRIQGFPDDYKMTGGKTRAMKYIGNSVCPAQAEANAGALFWGYVNWLEAA
jgi:DNA (cytosine-5)-methyltransferase 1